MNKQRKATLRSIRRILIDAKQRLESTLDEEDEARDNIPENLQGSSRYDESEECSEAMEEAIEHLDDAVDSITSAIETIELAI